MRRFKVSSRSEIGTFWTVEIDDEGTHCDCPAGSRDFDCNHKDLIRDFLNRKITDIKQLSRIEEI